MPRDSEGTKFTLHLRNATSIYGAVATMSNNAWYHVVGTYNTSHLCIYLNRVLANCTAFTGALVTNNLPLRIGRLSTGETNTEYFNGSLDEVRIWNRALSASEISQHYYSNLAKYAPDRWIFTSNQTFSPTGSAGIPYSIWVRDANTWGTNQTGRVVKRQ
jgi:hypothetical protein